ncbi:hypothetical protein LX64_00128 [Chitinophaga skermanii]|uniref:Gliding motility protein RemB n=1 Tax=Chitinophaga skermanii TaxID=331697 RepID=A0A327R2R1_9BACT|nr:hypothetical protein [Chitinophaga skermanii]RAJ10525.1 hypothetical protein LX64_00128 [Chitinophaga skermanii]
MKKKYILLFTLSVLGWHLSFAQNPGEQYRLNDYKNSGDSSSFHSSLRDFIKRPQVTLPQDDSARKRSWMHRKIFKEHLLEYNHEDYTFYGDFLPDFQVGRSNKDITTWLNTRGFEVGGTLGKNFSFRSSFYENQGKFPEYLNAYTRANKVIPGQGQYKDYNGDAFDFNYATALLSYDANKFLNFQLGYDRNFIGDGYRSMLLSDNSFSYPFLKIVATVGKIQYTTMWAQFIDMRYPKASYDNGFRKKWGIFNYLDWNVSKKISVGVFSSIIWQDSDSTGKRGFDMSYINPIIFTRPVEYSVGSPDNAIMGLNAKYAISKNSTLYGQFVLDEFKLKEFTSGNGWWANKFGGQLGFRSNDIFKVKNLNILTEVNAARPYTYSQRTTLNNYGHYNQPLAHPYGANFVEWVNLADYQYKRWYLRGQVTYSQYGLDTAGVNFGKDINKSYETRADDYHNKIGQGLKTNLFYVQGTVGFLLNPKNNLRLEMSAATRRESNNQWKNNETFFSIGLRSTFRRFNYDL